MNLLLIGASDLMRVGTGRKEVLSAFIASVLLTTTSEGIQGEESRCRSSQGLLRRTWSIIDPWYNIGCIQGCGERWAIFSQGCSLTSFKAENWRTPVVIGGKQILHYLSKCQNNNMEKYRLVNQLQYWEKIRVSLIETLFHVCEGEGDR